MTGVTNFSVLYVSGARWTGCHNPALAGSPFAALASVQDLMDLGKQRMPGKKDFSSNTVSLSRMP
jgi:hypothetical protein